MSEDAEDIHATNQKRLYDLRERVRDGEDVSEKEYTEIIADLRKSRTAAAPAKGKKKKEAKYIKPDSNLEDLFDKPIIEAAKV